MARKCLHNYYRVHEKAASVNGVLSPSAKYSLSTWTIDSLFAIPRQTARVIRPFAQVIDHMHHSTPLSLNHFPLPKLHTSARF